LIVAVEVGVDPVDDELVDTELVVVELDDVLPTDDVEVVVDPVVGVEAVKMEDELLVPA
jgi:hypothetical protein